MIDWNERYSEPGFAYGTSPNDFLREHIDRLPTGNTLSLAEGEGRNALFLSQSGHKVTAVDSSAIGLSKATELAAKNELNIKTVCTDLAEYRIAPESCDCIISVFCHVPPAIRQQLHRDIVAGLKPGGILLLEAYTPDQITLGTGGPPIAELTMTLRALKDELKGLEFNIAKETTREVIEGKYHTGKGAVVQVLAQKPRSEDNAYTPYI